MRVPVVQVGIVRVCVSDRLVPVHVGVGLDERAVMLVLVVFVVHMPVLVLDGLVQMVVLVALGQVRALVGEAFEIPQGAGKAAITAATGLIQQRLSTLVADLDRGIAAAEAHKARFGRGWRQA